MTPLTELDRRLLAVLREDGRAPVAELAAAGVIVGFTVRVREDAADGGVRAVSLIEVAGRSADGVIARLGGFPEIESLHTTNGAWDLVAEVRAADLAAFDALLDRIRAVPGVLNTATSLLLTSVLR
jgi:DNA-binding Lrp family transcriptional regulator